MRVMNLRFSAIIAVAAVAAALTAGCSQSGPTGSWMPSGHRGNGGPVYAAPGGDGRTDSWTVELSGYIAKVDPVNRVLVLDKEDQIVILPDNVRVVLLPDQTDTGLNFADLRVGKLVTVYGDLDADHNLVAKIIEFERDKPAGETTAVQS